MISGRQTRDLPMDPGLASLETCAAGRTTYNGAAAFRPPHHYSLSAILFPKETYLRPLPQPAFNDQPAIMKFRNLSAKGKSQAGTA